MVVSSYDAEKARRQKKTQLQEELAEARREREASERFREGGYRLGAAESPDQNEEDQTFGERFRSAAKDRALEEELEREELLRESQRAQAAEQRARIQQMAKEKVKQEGWGWARSLFGRGAAGEVAGVAGAGAGAAGAGAAAGTAGTAAAGAAGTGAAASALPVIGIILAVIVAIVFIIGLIVTILIYTCNESALGSAASKVASWVGIIPEDICAAFSFEGGGTGGAGATRVTPPLPVDSCTDAQKQQFATQNNVPYPARNAPELDTLIQCITSNVVAQGFATSTLGSIFTFEQRNPSCNYTRGQNDLEEICGACVHTEFSCHYGGRLGANGALAVDFGNEAIASQIISAADACGAGFAQLETGPQAHVHVSTVGCGESGNDF